VQQLVQLQAGRLQRQERAARQVSELTRELEPLVVAMEREQTTLRQSATDIWAEMSQPGLAPNPATALQLARASAVSASRVGAASEDLRTRSRHLLGLVNKVVSESKELTEEGQETEQRARDLLAALEAIEASLGDRPAQHAESTAPASAASLGPSAAPTAQAGPPMTSASGGRHHNPRGGMRARRPSPSQKRYNANHQQYGGGQGPGARPDSSFPPTAQPGNPQAGQGAAPWPPAGGQRNGGRPAQGPSRPPQAQPPQGDNSHPGDNSNGRWLND